MRFEKYLQEKYIGSKKEPQSGGHGRSYTIYENPTKMEIKLALEETPYHSIRFIADNLNKKVFIWASNLLHGYIWKTFLAKTYTKGRSKKFHITDNILPGTANAAGSTLTMRNSEQIEGDIKYNIGYKWSRDVLDIDWKWAEKYINGIEKYLNTIRSNIDKQ